MMRFPKITLLVRLYNQAAVSQPESIPMSIASGIMVGLIVGYMLYRSTSSKNVGMHAFIVFSSCLLFLVGGGQLYARFLFYLSCSYQCSFFLLPAGLFATGVARLEAYPFQQKVGGDLAESGSGPGSYDVRGNVFHFNQDWLNPFVPSSHRLK